jgi:hypothetical protein
MSNTDGRSRHRFGDESGIIVFGGEEAGAAQAEGACSG